MPSKLKEIGFATILMVIITAITIPICCLIQGWDYWLTGIIICGVIWVIMIIAILLGDNSYSGGGHNCTGNYNCICGGGGCD